MSDRYDVVVAGASLAGCAAATFLARSGLTVALVDRRPSVDAYKVACTHFIQASATPTIRRLGLDGAIEAAGGLRNGFDLWTRWGWVRLPARVHGPGPGFGYSVRRETLDPMLRRLALDTPGVEPVLGWTVMGLERGPRLRVAAPSGEERTLAARLVVGADGRDSTVARLAGLPVRRRPNRRFVYWAYYERLPLPPGPPGRFWHLEPDVAYALANDGGVTLVVVMPAVERLPAFRADRIAAFEEMVRALPEAPALDDAERVSPLFGQLEVPNVRRPPAGDRVALVGDAALACDPLPGVGCGWALQSAEWLAESVAAPLRAGGDLRAPLRAYAARHRDETSHHRALIERLSLAAPAKPYERLLVKAATRDDELAARVMAHWQRRIPVAAYLTPATFVRSLAVLGRDAVARRSSAV